MNYLNLIFNYILGFAQKKFNGKAIIEALNTHVTKSKPWQVLHKEMMYLVNVRFNQRKSKIIKQFKKTEGVEQRVLDAQQMVRDDPSLIPNGQKRRQFLKQSAKKVSKYLCNTIGKHWILTTFNKKMMSFELFYIKGVNDGGLIWAGGMYAKQYERNLMKTHCNYEASLKFDYSTKKGFSPKQILNKFTGNRDWTKALIRIQTGAKKWQGHTFIIVKNDQKEIIMYDQFHNHWSGVPLDKRKCLKKITNIYTFV